MSENLVPVKGNGSMKPTVKADGKVKDVHLDDLTYKLMYKYGIEVNENRALPDYRDGLKPVQRRVMWAAYQLALHPHKPRVKSARIVGETLGKYHPHGDQACYGAMVTMVNSTQNLIDGQGNWGSLTEPQYAAMRYTEARLSKYASRVFFDPFYLPVVKLVNNYDDREQEPLYLLSLLPNLLLNGTSGIGVGTKSDVPCYTLPSLIRVLKAILKGEPATPKSCMSTLEFTCRFGGGAVVDDDTKPEIRTFYKSGIGNILFESTYKLDADKRKIVFKRFAPLTNLSRVLERTLELEFVESVNDESEPNEFPGRIVVYLKKSSGAAKNIGTYARQVAEIFQEEEQFRINITERFINDKGEAEAKFRASTISELLNDWVKWRTELEIEACKYQISVTDKEIRRLEVLMIAVKHLDIILRALKKPFTDEQLTEYLSKQLKVTLDEARMILDLRVRQLKALEIKNLEARMKEQKERRATLKNRKARPQEFIAKQLAEFEKELV